MSCAPGQESNPTDGSAPKPAANEAKDARFLMNNYIHFQFVVYRLPSSTADSLDVLNSQLKNRFAVFRRVDKLQSSPSVMTIAARLQGNVKVNYAPPDLEYLRRFGRGLSGEQAKQLQDSSVAVVMDFGMPKQQLGEGLRAACDLSAAVAREIGGLIWDEQTREVFTPDIWEEMRLRNSVVPSLAYVSQVA